MTQNHTGRGSKIVKREVTSFVNAPITQVKNFQKDLNNNLPNIPSKSKAIK